MKYIGLDLGSKTCGIAVSDAFGMIARVHSTLRFDDDNYLYCAKKVNEIAKELGVNTIVLGLPKHMNGDSGIRADISYQFRDMLLAENASLDIKLWDERLTSITVNKAMLEANLTRKKRKSKKDELAAVVILQSFLDSI